MEAIEELTKLADSMRQAAALLNDLDFNHWLSIVQSAGKSAVLNSLIGHPALPTGEGGATRAPICIDLKRDENLSAKSIVLQIDSKSQPVSASAPRHSLQDRLSKISSKSRDEIYLKLKTSTSPPLKLIDLPGVDKGNLDDSLSEYAQHNDAVLLVVIPAAQAPEVSSAKALRYAKEYDAESTRTIGVISKVDQASSDPKILAAVQALLMGQGPRSAADIPWVVLIGQSFSITSAQSGSVGSDNSLETAWRAESESLKSILTGVPQSKLGRLALVETLAHQIRSRMKVRLPSLLSGLQGKSQIVQDELVRLGESMVTSSEGTRALALELCREFEDKFLQHIMTGEVRTHNLRLRYNCRGTYKWLNKIRAVMGAKRGEVKLKPDGPPIRQTHSDGSLDTMVRKPVDPQEDLRWMAQEVRGYVEAVLNSLAASVPKAVVLCQVEKAKEDMLNKLYSSVSSQSTARIEELLQEDGNVKRKREKIQKQSSLLSKLTRQLSIHDNRAAAATGMSNDSPAESPRSGESSGGDWRSAFDSAANGPTSLDSRFGSNGHGRRANGPYENGDDGAGSRLNSTGRRTPNRLPPAPPGSGSGYRY
ncbi:dynamin-2B-like [Bidens hawaiensis]|uniref:dynamin-2B-like n=1 Tax=Bidens hawaiensis TaxID=980011 RepID=UPI00404B6CAD